MKKIYMILIALLTLNGAIAQTWSPKPDDEETIASQEMKANAWKFKPASVETGENFDVKYYRCWWNIDPEVRTISGNVTTFFAPIGAGFNQLTFELAPDLTVETVKYHNNTLTWEHNSYFLKINMPSTLPAQVVDSVTVYYHGVPPDDGSGSFVRTTHNGTPAIWTQSVCYVAGDWWPCKMGLNDKADSIDIFINTPSMYRTASNGILVSEVTTGTSTVDHWKHRYPIATYLIAIAVTNYARYVNQVPYGGDTLDIINYVYPEDSAAIAASTEAIIPAVQLYDSLFGIYPFQNEKYGQAQYATGGMENQTMTFIASFKYNTMTHELGHSWFGDKITCGSWSDIWLNEGFAVYLTGLCYERYHPDQWVARRKGHVDLITSQPGGSVYCSETLNLGRVFDHRLTYEKGAMILHQIRWIIGDSAFFAGLRNYISDVSLAYGFARTSDLKSHFESSSGQDLTWYFDDWFTGEGYPLYSVGWTQAGNLVTVTLSQISSHPSVSFFELPVPIQFKNATHDTIIRFSNTFSGQQFTAEIPFEDTVIVDPEYQLITGKYTVGIADISWQHNLQIYPNPAGEVLNVIPEKQSGNMSFNINSSDGKLVTTGILTGNKQQINIMNLAGGQYSIVFRSGDLTATRSFIKTVQ